MFFLFSFLQERKFLFLFQVQHFSSLSLSEERVRERFHATYATLLVQPTSMAASLALNLSRRDKHRADLSSDK
jgi:hypothetical protein